MKCSHESWRRTATRVLRLELLPCALRSSSAPLVHRTFSVIKEITFFLVCGFLRYLVCCYFVGEKGRRIRELTSVVQKRFNFPEGSVELYAEKVNNRGLCATAQAESLRYKLLGGLAVRRYYIFMDRYFFSCGLFSYIGVFRSILTCVTV